MKNITTILLAFLLTACAGGREFVKPEAATTVLGATTYDQIVKSHGEPRRTGTLTQNGMAMKTITYSYSVAVPFSTKLSARAMVFAFWDDTLVSYDYISSFDEDRDAIQIDDEKVKQLAKGDRKSTVIALLGKPSGEAIYPLVSAKGDSLVRYSYMNSSRVPFNPVPIVTRKVLRITFDSNDAVTEIISSETKP